MAVDKKSQSDKFKKLAKEAECDPSESKFDASLKRIIDQKQGADSSKKSDNRLKTRT